MTTQTYFVFPPFQLDLRNEQLRHDAQALALRPKTFAVLRYLVEHPGVLVTKDALLDAVWSGTVVSEAALKTCIRELRRVLGDDDQAPRFIETVHGRGYRFIAPVVSRHYAGTGREEEKHKSQENSQKSIPIPSTQHPIPMVVGREAELAQLHRWFGHALNGERQIVFVTGEPGIGKTTVAEMFLSQIAPSAKMWIGRGQCVEQYGTGEAYMPILEALGRLCREPQGEHLIALLHRYAPTWLAQLPTVLEPVEMEALQHRTQHTTRERMLRELAEAVVALTVEQPLVLRLEDLHWSDHSTLSLLSVLARWQEPARLLVLGTYRPVEMLQNGNSLRAVTQELYLHKLCEELRLGLLTANEVAVYVSERLAEEVADRRTRETLARAIYQRTEGNPLFMVTVVDDLRTQTTLGEIGAELRGLPPTIQQMIERQFDRLRPEEQQVLAVASVAGAQFSAAAVAAGTQMAIGDVETYCAGLVRHEQFLRTAGISEWPDGTVATRYGFLHAVYQDVLYERTPAGQRVSLHKWIGERQEQAYGNQTRAIAAELAVHFERGREYRKAVTYLHQAGENALQRAAHQEAVSLLTRGLELLETLPDTHDRSRQELTLQVALGTSLMATKGQGSPEVGLAYGRAKELCAQVGEESPQFVLVLLGLCNFYMSQGELQEALQLGAQLLRLAQNTKDQALLAVAHRALGVPLVQRGEFVRAREHFEHGIALYDLRHYRSAALRYGGYDPVMACLCWAAWAVWHLGYPDQALQRIQEALTLAQDLSSPPNLVAALSITNMVLKCRRDVQRVKRQAEAGMTLATDHGFLYWLAIETMLRGWALTEQGLGVEGMSQLSQGFAAYRTTGSALGQPYFLALRVEACLKTGQAAEGLNMVAEALGLVKKTGERQYEAELYRLKGELLLQLRIRNSRCGIPKEAEECFQQALDVARHQRAKSLELRAATSLARLWQQQGKTAEAREMLAEIYGWFTEGFDTKDLQEAKALLEELT